MSVDPKTGLVLQGGGARGAYQSGALRAIAEITGSSENPFPIISGTSVGAINAASLASHAGEFQAAALSLEKLWRGLNTAAVFKASPSAVLATIGRIIWTFGLRRKASRYGWLDNSPLRELLGREFNRPKIDAAIAKGELHGLCITTSCYACGIAVTFFEGIDDVKPWMRARREGKNSRINVDHLMASSALPFIFPAVKIDNTWHGDGALRLTAPLSPIIRMGADRILVIGVRDAEVHLPEGKEENAYPSVGEMVGHALDILFNDNLDADIERVDRINELLSHTRDDVRGSLKLRPLTLLSLQPSKDLREIARKFEYEMPFTIRLILKMIGGLGSDGRLPSYLLFEPGYLGALIDLGYRDTMARADEIRAFLDA